MQPDTLSVVTIAQRPDLLPVVATWLWHQFWGPEYTFEQVRDTYADCVAPVGAPQCFVLLRGTEPVGTATLARHDLDERPDLTPWLAGVYVVPEARGQGLVQHLIAAVEDAARQAGTERLWLYTNRAAPVYRRAGWQDVETVPREGRNTVLLMAKDLTPARTPGP